MSRIKFLNIEVDNLTMDEAVERSDELIQENRCSYVVTPNLDHIVQIEKDPFFKEVYDHADLILTDGKPLIWISKFKNNPIKEKVSGSDFFPRICELSARKGYKIFILGAAEGVADIAAKNLKNKYQNLQIVGTYSPPFGFENNQDEIAHICSLLNESKPDILACALGAPKSEKFVYKHLKDLNVPLSMSIGATIDFEAGVVKRAPKWMSDVGLEWFYRMIKDPKRLVKRYFNDVIGIIPILFKY